MFLPSGESSNRSLKSKDVIGLRIDGEFISSSHAANRQQRNQPRLPAEQLRRVTAEHIWMAVQALLGGGEAANYGDSVDYDLLADDGVRLPPKHVFGLAATAALGFDVMPFHFTAGRGTTCFDILETAGYKIVPKGEVPQSSDAPLDPNEREWAEGEPKLVTHYRRERAPGLANAKKAEFMRQHGRLICERCSFDPVAQYGDIGDACIEVHHDAFRVTDMPANHLTTLKDLKCLCANCHRIVHRQIAMKQAE